MQITCNSHNCPRRAVGVNYWKEQFKLLASYEGLHTDYVRLCEITCRLCEITCNSHNCLRRVVGVNYWKEQFKLLASCEGLHADYVRLCEIT